MRIVRLRGMSVRATSQPNGAAKRQQVRLTLAAMMKVVSSGSTNTGSVKRVAKLASVKERSRSVKANTMSQPIGSVTSRQRTTANAAITAAERSRRAGEARPERPGMGSRVMERPFAKRATLATAPVLAPQQIPDPSLGGLIGRTGRGLRKSHGRVGDTTRGYWGATGLIALIRAVLAHDMIAHEGHRHTVSTLKRAMRRVTFASSHIWWSYLVAVAALARRPSAGSPRGCGLPAHKVATTAGLRAQVICLKPASGGELDFKLVLGFGEAPSVGGAQYQLRSGLAVPLERIAAHGHVRVAFLQGGEHVGDLALGPVQVERGREHLFASLEEFGGRIEHHLHDGGNAGHHDHVAQHEPRRN